MQMERAKPNHPFKMGIISVSHLQGGMKMGTIKPN